MRSRMKRFAAASSVIFLSMLGCSEEPGDRDSGPERDAAGSGDVGILDAGASDAGGNVADALDAAGADDGGTTLDSGASVGDDGGAADAGPTDAGPPDPRFCPAGVADGCCSLALRYGGADPDCASLACATATLTEPIVLDDVPPAYAGTAAMSWT
jgi:hypothetical protein